jgi:hypothetical protein
MTARVASDEDDCAGSFEVKGIVEWNRDRIGDLELKFLQSIRIATSRQRSRHRSEDASLVRRQLTVVDVAALASFCQARWCEAEAVLGRIAADDPMPG